MLCVLYDVVSCTVWLIYFFRIWNVCMGTQDYVMYVLYTGAIRPMVVCWLCYVWSVCFHFYY